MFTEAVGQNLQGGQNPFQHSKQVTCQMHPECNVEYICKTERIGLCSKCLYSHYKEGHQIQCIKDMLKNIKSLVEDMESKVITKSKKNKTFLEEHRVKLDEYISNKEHLLQE